MLRSFHEECVWHTTTSLANGHPYPNLEPSKRSRATLYRPCLYSHLPNQSVSRPFGACPLAVFHPLEASEFYALLDSPSLS